MSTFRKAKKRIMSEREKSDFWICLFGARTSFRCKVVSLEVVSLQPEAVWLQPEIFLTLLSLQLDVVSLQNVFNSFCLDPG